MVLNELTSALSGSPERILCWAHRKQRAQQRQQRLRWQRLRLLLLSLQAAARALHPPNLRLQPLQSLHPEEGHLP